MLAKMSFLWNDHSPTHSKPKNRVKDGTKETVSGTKSLDEEDRPKTPVKAQDVKDPVIDKDPETKDKSDQPEADLKEKKTSGKESEHEESLVQPKSQEETPVETSPKTEDSIKRVTSEKVHTKSAPSKVSDDSAQATKRKLFETTHIEFDDFEEKQNNSGILKRVKRTHKSEVKVPNLRVANAITSSLSSSMFERESPTKPVSKRKHLSPEHIVNDKKCPKKVDETIKSKGDAPGKSSSLNQQSFANELSQPTSESQSMLSDVSLNSVQEVTSPKPRVLEFNSFTTESVRQNPEDEEDRRLEFLDVEALEADRKRDQARAEKFLAALDAIE